MKNIIIIHSEKSKEAWSSLTGLCKEHNLPYHTLKVNDFPFEWNGLRFEKLKIKR